MSKKLRPYSRAAVRRRAADLKMWTWSYRVWTDRDGRRASPMRTGFLQGWRRRAAMREVLLWHGDPPKAWSGAHPIAAVIL